MVKARLVKKIGAKRVFLFVFVLVISFLLQASLPLKLFALTDAQKKVLGSGILYFNTEPDNTVSCSGSTTSTVSSGSAGPVYFVGDSIGTQVQTSLPAALGGIQFKANALAGRNLSGAPPSPDGLTAIDQDQDFIKTASTVVIELGTNTGGFTAQAVGQMVSKIHSLSANATIYWIDTAVVQRADYAKTLDGINGIIYSQAQADNYQVISWNKKVFGDSADPKNINAAANDNGYIRHADEFVHLTDAGIQAMTGLIATTVSNGHPADANGCACTPLAGNDNATKIWNYFIGKGLAPFQVAAILGNFQAESGFNPKRVEGGWGFPAEMDSIPPNVGPKGQPGYGIAQWTSPGRKTGLGDKATAENKPVYDLGVQLDYVWDELQGPYQSVLNQLKQSADIASANSIFGPGYEGFGTNTESLRLGFGKAWLAKLGSSTPGSSTTGVSIC